jgi:CDP-diacylglycerol--glycerol-3-phosphate 3-phosphatidyltransferase
MLYSLKGRFQSVAKFFIYGGLTANMATILGWIFVVLSASALYFGLTSNSSLLIIFPVLMLFRFIFNALDGLIARKQNKASAMGELVNELSDIWGDTIIFGTLFFIPAINPVFLGILLVTCWFAEFTGVMGRALPPRQRMHASLLGGKSERGLFLSLYILTVYFVPSLAGSFNEFIVIISVAVFLTGLFRIYKISQASKNLPYQSFTPYGE